MRLPYTKKPANLKNAGSRNQSIPQPQPPKHSNSTLAHEAPFLKQTSRHLQPSQSPSPRQNLDIFHNLLHRAN